MTRGNQGKEYVFICGMNRTGTHLLFSLLSGHEKLFVTGIEDAIISAIARGGPVFEKAIANKSLGKLYRVLIAYSDFLDLKFMARQGGRDYSKAPMSYEATISLEMDYPAFEEDFFSRITDDDGVVLDADTPGDILVSFYQALARAFNEEDKKIIVAKPAVGIRQFLEAEPYLGNMKPKIIFTTRDPRAIAASMTRGKGSVRAAVQEFRTEYESFEALQDKYPVYTCRYEDICTETENTMRQIAEFIGIEYDDLFLVPQLQGQPFMGNSSFEEIGNTVSTASLERWKTVLSKKQVQEAELIAGPYIKKAGYEYDWGASGLNYMIITILEWRRRLRLAFRNDKSAPNTEIVL